MLLSLLARDGRAWLRFLTNRFRVADILGKTVVIHADPDDFHTQPAGDSGMKVACGVIRPVRRRYTQSPPRGCGGSSGAGRKESGKINRLRSSRKG